MFNNGRYSPPGKSILDMATGLLFLFGLGLSLLRWRVTALWWSMLFVPLADTQILTSNTPDAARAVVVAPFMYLFAGLSLDSAYVLVPRPGRVAGAVALAVGVLAISVVNIKGYCDWIQSPNAALVRGPSVEYDQYSEWRDSIRCNLRSGVFAITRDGEHRCTQAAD